MISEITFEVLMGLGYVTPLFGLMALLAGPTIMAEGLSHYTTGSWTWAKETALGFTIILLSLILLYPFGHACYYTFSQTTSLEAAGAWIIFQRLCLVIAIVLFVISIPGSFLAYERKPILVVVMPLTTLMFLLPMMYTYL